MKLRSAVVGGLLLVAVALVCRAEPVKAKTYLTPKAVFAAAKEAAQKDDFRTFFACLTPDSQKMMACEIVITGLRMKNYADSGVDKTGKAKEALKPLDVLFKKHGLTAEVLKKIKPATDAKEAGKNLRAVADAVKDKAGFCSEFMTLAQKGGGRQGPGPYSDATLTDVRIEGDKAKGTLEIKKGDKKTKEPIAFVKINGGWRLVAPEPKPPPRPPAPPR